ncbi:hypothetical protein [Arthrobacter sp. efr-133-TYG-118]|uniref:hypothetical protein n=1 Tax=Arthrobacter sp. efr-133-TYG-118 TaxID=3040279 RepID=UPI00254D5E9C|nr:hypothetical protein [Arthrobacter sp. efr-133-TYG-118]
MSHHEIQTLADFAGAAVALEYQGRPKESSSELCVTQTKSEIIFGYRLWPAINTFARKARGDDGRQPFVRQAHSSHTRDCDGASG